MKHLLDKVSASKSKVRAHFKMGHDILNIVSKDARTAWVLNGHEVLKHSKDINDQCNVHILSDLIRNRVAKSKTASVSVLMDDSEMQDAVDNVKVNLSQDKILLKILPIDVLTNKLPSDDFDVSSTVDMSCLVDNLKSFLSTIREMSRVLKVCYDDALTLTQGRMVDSMWGAKEVQRLLQDLKWDIEGNSQWGKIEFFSGIIEKSIERLLYKLDTNLAQMCDEEKKIMATVLIPNILDNFGIYKKIATDVLLCLSSLVYIDAIFKRMTTYPAIWFMNKGMLSDLEQDYQKLLCFIAQIPVIEKKVIYPMDFLKISLLNGIK